jgi:hypothetical protein
LPEDGGIGVEREEVFWDVSFEILFYLHGLEKGIFA